MLPTITTIPLLQLASGDRLFLQVYKFIGAQPGKKAYLQANLHGAEITGNAVIHRLIEWLSALNSDQLSGEIWLVPVCNPLGTNQRSHYFASGRFNPYDGKDWNRIFWDYEKEDDDLMEFARSQVDLDLPSIQKNYRQRMQVRFSKLSEKLNAPNGVSVSDRYRLRLQALCLDADYVIDLHTSAGNGLDYLYYFRRREVSARLFLLSAGILLDEYDGDAFDECFIKPWLALEDRLGQLGRDTRFDVEAWTLELGAAMQLNAKSIDKGVQGIQNYLIQKGMIKLPDFPATPPLYHDMQVTARSKITRYYAPRGGLVQACVPLGTFVTAGQRLYQLLCFNKAGELPILVEVQAAQAGLVYDVALNHAVNEGEYVLGML
jgi:predicted deacylase